MSNGTPLFAVVESVVLRAAVRRIVDNWDELATGWLASRDEGAEALVRISREVERIRTGRAPIPEGEGRTEAEDEPAAAKDPRPLLHHRLSEVLRTEVLRSWRTVRGSVGAPRGAGAGIRAEGEAEIRRDQAEGTPPASNAAAAEDILELLVALEEYRVGLWPAGSEELGARLAEPDAMELIVEVAHDLLSPLNSILFLAEVLRTGHSGPVNDHQRSQLGLMYSATLGMISIVTDVMDLAGERESESDDDPSLFSVGTVFDSVQEMVRPMAEEKGIGLEFRAPERDRCFGHPGLLGRVLLNLTTNALKFTESGEVTVLAEARDSRTVEFSVRDTGRGIPAEEQARLFHPFRKAAHRSGHFFSGSGLGLSIARRLVAAMGSELKLQSAPGEGSVFYFRLELPAASRR